jgi:hypothetical protein
MGPYSEIWQFTADHKFYWFGDEGPTGGWIVYDDEAPGAADLPGSLRYIEMAPYDYIFAVVWSNVVYQAAGTSAAVGTGQANTDAIRAQSGHSSGAAEVCHDFSVTHGGVTYSDWFLPARDTLTIMSELYLDYTDVDEGMSAGTAEAPGYWSSTEYDSDEAWARIFNSVPGFPDPPYEAHVLKGAMSPDVTQEAFVRPVRSF